MLEPCSSCGTAVLSGSECPHCGGSTSRTSRSRAVALLALGLAVGCDNPGPEPDYGVPETGFVDFDQDGWDAIDDCDDDNADVNPGAEETPGDGVDSNCDGEDDT